MAKRVLITGITGQDGSYLAELLLDKGYDVYGMVRRSSAPNLWRIQHIVDRIVLKPADLLDQLSLLRLVDSQGGAIEFGGVIRSLDGGEHWENMSHGQYVNDDTVDMHGVLVGRWRPGCGC